MNSHPKISVIIVNYNVKEYLEQALLSIKKALVGISYEIFVVDNASVDGSVPYIRKKFPDIQIIENKENLGFGRANNLALKEAKGEYVVLINPDTVVQENTFVELLRFFESHPDASAATCKIINPDGSFSVDCRHNIPTPMVAFWKVTGLSRLFPKSKVFGRYNLTYLDPDQIYPVPAISGSFMMIRKNVLDEIGYFDEQFFMYCEDIDLCYRIHKADHKIYYVPTTQIIHYKGESTKKDRLDYVITFNKALYQFFKKHYAQSYIFFIRWIIVLGIVLRGIFVFIRNFLRNHAPLILDLALLNLVVLFSFIIRFETKSGFLWQNFFRQYWIINVISSVLFLFVAFYFDVYPKHRLSVQSIIKTNILSFTLLASLTFFLKQFAYSRMVVLFAGIFSPLLMIAWRSILKKYYRGDHSAWGRDILSKPTVIVGNGKGLLDLYQKIRNMKDLNYSLVGVILQNNPTLEPDFQEKKIPVLGKLENIGDLIRIHDIKQIIFSTESLSYEQILGAMTRVKNPFVDFKIVPSHLEVMIGKSQIEKMDDYPFMEIEYAIGKIFNRVTKRTMDIVLSFLMLIATSPAWVTGWLFKSRKSIRIELSPQSEHPTFIKQFRNAWKVQNNALLLWEILKGKLSFVGAPLLSTDFQPILNTFYYKPGLTGLVQLNTDKINAPEDAEKYHIFYVKNQSLLLDLEIISRAIFRKKLFPVVPVPEG